jgi:hypothetical protein
VHALESFNRFDLDYHYTLDEEIQPIAAVDPLVLVDDRQRLLSLEAQAACRKFNGQARFVGVFQQPRPELVVNFKRRPDNRFCQNVYFRSHALTPCKDRAAPNIQRSLDLLRDLCDLCVDRPSPRSPYTPIASRCAPDSCSMSLCKLFPCASIVTMAGKSLTIKCHIASGVPNSSSETPSTFSIERA